MKYVVLIIKITTVRKKATKHNPEGRIRNFLRNLNCLIM